MFPDSFGFPKICDQFGCYGLYDRILNSSIAVAFAWRGMSAYRASKVALVRLAETLALDLAGKNVQVNAMRPGVIDTTGLWGVIDGWRKAGHNELFELGKRLLAGSEESVGSDPERRISLVGIGL